VKVLFLTHSYPRRTGDAPGSFLLRLAQALRDEDIEVSVVAPGAPGLAESERLDGIDVRRFRYAPRRYENLAYGGNMAALVRDSWSARMSLVGFLGAEFSEAVAARREVLPDVIHAHWWFPNALVGTWLARLSGLPLVTTLHGSDVRLGRTVGFARPGMRHVLRQSAAVTVVSRWLQEQVRAVDGQTPTTVAPMPVATDLFTPGTGRTADRLLFVGRLNRQKGIETLLRAVAASQAAPSLDVIGDGDLRQPMEALAGTLGIQDRVRFRGALPQQELRDYYRAAAAVVIPSIEEGLGLVGVEAQLCETPVIAFNSGGLTDVVQDQRTGILVQEPTAPALTAAIDGLLSSPDHGAALGAAGRLHALATFAPQSVARRYAEVYRAAREHQPA
jgi:glycosyltransferase involved in cell wall biosynthesis